MRDEEFISEVGARAGLNAHDAERAIHATLAVLGEQLPDSVVGQVATVLPERLGEQLWGQRTRSRAAAAQAGRLSRGVARGEGSWPGDDTAADADIDSPPKKSPMSAQTRSDTDLLRLVSGEFVGKQSGGDPEHPDVLGHGKAIGRGAQTALQVHARGTEVEAQQGGGEGGQTGSGHPGGYHRQ